MTDGELLDMDAKQEVERMAKKLDKMVTKKNTVGAHQLLGGTVCVCVCVNSALLRRLSRVC